MKISIKMLMAIYVMLSLTEGNAQTKNIKTETVKIYGNCALCESTIEKAGNFSKEASVDWDKNTKMAILSYDSLNTTKEEILKRIALAGYDSDSFFAPDDTYANLAECCQYERAKKEAYTVDTDNKNTSEHSKHGSMTKGTQEKNPLTGVLENYFAVKDALVNTNGSLASSNAERLLTAVNEVPMEKLSMDVHMVWMKVVKNIKENLGQMLATKDVDKQRNYFMALSKNMYEIIKVSKSETPVYYQFCPMADGGKGANWLSREDIIKNPYYGSQMLSCGKTVETLN